MGSCFGFSAPPQFLQTALQWSFIFPEFLQTGPNGLSKVFSHLPFIQVSLHSGPWVRRNTQVMFGYTSIAHLGILSSHPGVAGVVGSGVVSGGTFVGAVVVCGGSVGGPVEFRLSQSGVCGGLHLPWEAANLPPAK